MMRFCYISVLSVFLAFTIAHFSFVMADDDCFLAFSPTWQEYFVTLNDKESIAQKTQEKKIEMSVRIKQEKNTLFINVIDWESVIEKDGLKIFDAKEYIKIHPELEAQKQKTIVIELDKDLRIDADAISNTPDLFFNLYMVKTIPFKVYADNRFQKASTVEIEGIPIKCDNKIVLSDNAHLFSVESKGCYDYKDNVERVMLGKISFEMSVSYSKISRTITKCSYLFSQKQKSDSRELTFKMEAK